MHRTLRDRLSAVGPRLFVVALLTALILLGYAPPGAGAENGTQVVDMEWTVAGDVASVTMRLTGPVRYRTASSSKSIAVDLWTAHLPSERAVPVGRGVASGLSLRQVTPGMVRLQVSLRERSRFKVYSLPEKLTVKVFPEWQSTVPIPQSISYRMLPVPTGAGRARAHVVTIDPRSEVLIRPALSGDVISSVERTSTAAVRLEAIAAINGSFYSGYSGLGLPIGLIVIDGRVLSAPFPRRTVFGVDAAGRPWIGPVEFAGRLVKEGGAEIPISAINRPPRWGGVAVYTPEYGPFTAPQAYVVIVREGRVTGFTSGRAPIPSDGYALAVAASQRFMLEGLTREQPLTLDLAVRPATIHHALQGGPRLVRNGRVHVPYHWEGFGPGFYRTRTARSAIGITASGKVLFVTVDRRDRRRRSSGINLAELARLMRALGARDAVNLDGGGSATLVVGGRIVSAVSRGGERHVSATLVAVRRPADKAP